ncbi:MAG: Asp-tRNA(Asn)/Glu-tRNA(Gln) amidotransferase subunit GatA, partial [Francisellaceae bacterium]|nr:Asp-tRNA(Asn)/Glu-tRNA(Gln) amidotransferase subunit GatA [Francisellaceae bacterium]
MHNQTIAELSKALSKGKISSVELTKHFLDRINTHDAKLNAFITVTDKLALEAAQNADKTRSSGNSTSLTGIPIAHKDIFCTTGIKSSCGSKMLDNFISPYESTVTQKLKDSGMVMLGKTNMDEFAMGSSNETSFYGPVKNPWDLERVPGGSSGGSAAAVAARIAPCSTGTDTGGSVRQPASLCGLTGLKPSYGRVSRFGMIAFASSLDQAGVLAHSAEDCAMLLEHMSGFDEKDSTSFNTPVPKYSEKIHDSIKGLTIGLPKEFFNDDLPEENAALIEENVKVLEDMGAKIKRISLPNMHMSIPVYYIIAPAECSSNLARYDGIKFGYRHPDIKDLQELYIKTR